MIYKGFTGNVVKDVDTKQGIVTGYYSVFGNIDSDGDMIMPGAFTKTISENGPQAKNRIMHLWQHNPTEPIGKPHVLKEDNYGLYFETKLIDTSKGADAIKLYEAGVINEHSIGFNVVKKEQKADHVSIQEIKLWEGSTVTWGANELSSVVGMKSGEDKLLSLIQNRDSLIKAVDKGNFTDETFELLTERIKFLTEQLTQFYKDLTKEITEPVSHSAEIKDDLKADDVAALIKSINFKIG